MAYRVLVTGSREWTDYDTIARILATELKNHPDLLVVHGDATRGADSMAKHWCIEHHVAQEPHPADWRLGKGAGFLRNVLMVNLGAEVVHAFLAPKARGTRHCIKEARKVGIPVVSHEQAVAPLTSEDW